MTNGHFPAEHSQKILATFSMLSLDHRFNMRVLKVLKSEWSENIRFQVTCLKTFFEVFMCLLNFFSLDCFHFLLFADFIYISLLFEVPMLVGGLIK